jgi:hypothetical protein
LKSKQKSDGRETAAYLLKPATEEIIMAHKTDISKTKFISNLSIFGVRHTLRHLNSASEKGEKETFILGNSYSSENL